MDNEKDIVDLWCEYVKETDLAILFNFGGKQDVWIPKNVITYKYITESNEAFIEVYEWFAFEKDLI